MRGFTVSSKVFDPSIVRVHASCYASRRNTFLEIEWLRNLREAMEQKKNCEIFSDSFVRSRDKRKS